MRLYSIGKIACRDQRSLRLYPARAGSSRAALRLAGVPAAVVKRAGTLLRELEERAGDLTDASALPLFASSRPAPTPEPVMADPVHEALAAIDPDTLTPREALDALYKLRGLLLGAAAG